MSLLASLLDVNLPYYTLILLSATILLSIVCFSHLIISYGRKPKYPTVDIVDRDFRDILEKGVAKVDIHSPIFVIKSSSQFDAEYRVNDIDHLKKLPESICAQYKVFKEDLYYRFTGFPESANLLISVVKKDLTRNIQYSLKQVQDELKYSFDKEFCSCEDWKSWILYQNIARIAALISGRVFVGQPLSRNDEWVDMSVNYALQVLIVKDAIYKWPIWTRDIVAPHLKEVKSLSRLQKRVIELIKPLIHAHLANHENKKLYSEYGDKEGNIITWLLSRKGPNELQKQEHICENILLLLFGSIHTTSNAVIQAIFDLASYREYIPILLEEFQQVVQEDGCKTSEEGQLQLPKSSFSRLSKLDSFLKESQRMNPTSLVSHSREAAVDFRLSNGCLIPKGTRIALPSWVIHNESTSLFSPGHTKPLSEFDGLRYHNLRRLPGNENRHYFVSTSPDSLAFGHGNHACPGRFFASNEIKVILLEFLRNWEFRFPEDEKLQGGAWRRPKNFFIELDCLPDLRAHIEIKRRNV